MGKRANGEGSVFQRKDGRWQAELVVPAQGLSRTTTKTVYGKTQREAIAKLQALKDQLRDGMPVATGSPTVADYGRAYLDVRMSAEVARGHNAESTRRNYTDIWNRHIAPDLGHLRLDQLTPTVLREWAAAKATQPRAHGSGTLSAATQARIYAVLRAALNAAVQDEILHRNPLNKVKPPKNPTSKATPLTPPELGALLGSLRGHWLHPLVLLMALTGARPGEALAASWADIDLESRRWHISRSITRLPVPVRAGSRTTLGVKGTKTEASDAVIALPALAVDELRRHRAEQARRRLAARAWGDPDLVFTTTVGTLIDPRNALRELKAAALAAGIIRNVRLHDLRHTAASSLLAEGVDITVTSKLLRHTRLATTSDIYSHLLDEVRTGAADVMDRRMRKLIKPDGIGPVSG